MRHYFLMLILFFTSFVAFGQSENYVNGLKAFDAKDYSKAFKLLKQFADSGDSMAEFAIGYCYLNPELHLKNDSLAEHYLLSSVSKFNSNAMSMLSVYYFEKGAENEKSRIQALVWAEIAGSYNPAFNATTRFLIRSYLNETELNEVEKILKDKKGTYDKIDLDSFYKLNKQVKSNDKDSEKTKIPLNKYNLIENPYTDWVYRWKHEQFECDTMYYTARVESSVIDSTLDEIKNTRSFEVHFLYRDNKLKTFIITKEEQVYLTKELEKLKDHSWPPNMFPYSKCLEPTQIQSTFKLTENLPTEKEKNMCSIVYSFSKPIFIRGGSIALYLDQKRYRTNYTQLEFAFYILENNQWDKIATVYKYYESPKN